MTHLVKCLARAFLFIIFSAPMLVLFLLASLYLCEKLSKRTESEKDFYLGLFTLLSGVPCYFLSEFLLGLIDGWIGWG